MAIRILEVKRILKDDGGICLHCDPTMSRYPKAVMDAIFGRGNFRSEIIRHNQAGTRGGRNFGEKHDVNFP